MAHWPATYESQVGWCEADIFLRFELMGKRLLFCTIRVTPNCAAVMTVTHFRRALITFDNFFLGVTKQQGRSHARGWHFCWEEGRQGGASEQNIDATREKRLRDGPCPRLPRRLSSHCKKSCALSSCCHLQLAHVRCIDILLRQATLKAQKLSPDALIPLVSSPVIHGGSSHPRNVPRQY